MVWSLLLHFPSLLQFYNSYFSSYYRRREKSCQDGRCVRKNLGRNRFPIPVGLMRSRRTQECRGRQPFAGARGVLAKTLFLLLRAAAGGDFRERISPTDTCTTP